MRNSRFTTQQVLGILAETSSGMTVAQICAKHGISVPTYYLWKSKHLKKVSPSGSTTTTIENLSAAPPVGDSLNKHDGTGDIVQLRQRIHQLEMENEVLKKLFVESSLAQALRHNSIKPRAMPEVA